MAQNAGELLVQDEDWQGLNKQEQGRRWDEKVKVTHARLTLQANVSVRKTKTSHLKRAAALGVENGPRKQRHKGMRGAKFKCTYRLIGGCRSRPQV